MPLVAEVDITLDVQFGTVDYAFLDRVIREALESAHVPVLDVEVSGLRPLGPTVDPLQVQAEQNGPFAQPAAPITRPPGHF